MTKPKPGAVRGRPRGTRSEVAATVSMSVRLYEDEAGWVLSRGKPSTVIRGLIRAEREREIMNTDGEKKP